MRLTSSQLSQIFLFLSFLPRLVTFNAHQVAAFEIGGSFSAGFDSNPAEERESQGSGFSDLALKFTQLLPSPKPVEVSFDAESQCSQYEAGKKIFEGQATLSVESQPVGELFFVTASAGGGFYRDELVRDDEMNQALAEVSADWIAGPKVTCSLSYHGAFLHYLHKTLPFGGRPGHGGPDGPAGHAGSQRSTRQAPDAALASPKVISETSGTRRSETPPDPGGGSGGTGGRHLLVRRDDYLQLVSLALAYNPTSRLALNLTLSGGHLDSEVPVEDYEFGEIAVSPTVNLTSRLTITSTWALTKYLYQAAPRHIIRHDYKRSLSFLLKVTGEKVEPFLRVHVEELDSRLSSESYKRILGECGILF